MSLDYVRPEGKAKPVAQRMTRAAAAAGVRAAVAVLAGLARGRRGVHRAGARARVGRATS
jgi:hypothetical protein